MVLLVMVNSLHCSFLRSVTFVDSKSSLFSTCLLLASCRYTAFRMVSKQEAVLPLYDRGSTDRNWVHGSAPNRFVVTASLCLLM